MKAFVQINGFVINSLQSTTHNSTLQKLQYQCHKIDSFFFEAKIQVEYTQNDKYSSNRNLCSFVFVEYHNIPLFISFHILYSS